MSKDIQYVIKVLESKDFGRIVNLSLAMDGHPDAQEIYKYLKANRPELLQRLLAVEDTL